MTQSPYPGAPTGSGPAAYPPPPAGSPYAAYPSVGYAPGQLPTPMVVRTNTLAVVTLITGLLGMSVVSVILGHISLQTIKRTGERGFALAVIGLVLGYLGLAAILAAIGLAVLASFN